MGGAKYKKKFHALLTLPLFLYLIASSSAAMQAFYYVPSKGQISYASPEVMIKAVGTKFNVRFSGWGGLRNVEPDPLPYILKIKSLGFNTIRVTFCPALWAGPTGYYSWDGLNLDKLENIVILLREQRMYAIIDCHNWQDSETALQEHEEEWLQIWASVINRLKKYDHIMWEPYNEIPIRDTALAQRLYQRWIDQCRSLGSKHLVIVSPHWGNFFGVSDPENNWCQCRHFHMSYAWSDPYDEADIHIVNSPDSYVKVRDRFGVPFINTELGFGDWNPPDITDERLRMMQHWVDLLEQYEIPYFHWFIYPHGSRPSDLEDWGHKINHIEYPTW